MATNILTLPLITSSFSVTTNSDIKGTRFVVGPFGGGSPIDLTGVVFRMMWRLTAGSPNVYLDAQTTGYPLSGGVTPNGWLINNGVAGTITMNIPLSAVSALNPATYVADIVGQDIGAGVILEVAQITWTLSAGATH